MQILLITNRTFEEDKYYVHTQHTIVLHYWLFLDRRTEELRGVPEKQEVTAGFSSYHRIGGVREEVNLVRGGSN